VKPLPGAKLCAGMDTQGYLAALAEFRMLNAPRPGATLDAFRGGPNLLLSAYNATDTPEQRHPVTGAWVPAEPSNAQLREALFNAAVVPLACAPARRALADFCAAGRVGKGRAPRSLMLYGPRGAGKTHLAQAVAAAAGALLVNVSSGVTDGKCVEKGGAAKLLHMAFEVAKDPAMGPVVIYVDEVEKMLPGAPAKGKPKPDPNGPARFKKDLMTYIASLTVEHDALVIGTSSEPWAADAKLCADAFDVLLYVPPLDHGARVRAWRREVAEAVAEYEEAARAAVHAAAAEATGVAPPARDGPPSALAAALEPPLAAGAAALPQLSAAAAGAAADGVLPAHPWLDKLSYSALAAVTAGYTAGAIRHAARAVLSRRRCERWAAGTPVTEAEFVAPLSALPRVYAGDADAFRAFTDAVTGLDEARKKDAGAAAAPAKKK